MSLKQFEKLEELSRKAADKSYEVVDRERQDLRVLEQQSRELNAINREYQQSIVGKNAISPQLLAHRRIFVAKLTSKLEGLDQQRDQKRLELQQRMVEHRKQNAQHEAIDTVYKRLSSEHVRQSQRYEQQQMDDAYRSLNHQHKINRENNHE